MDDQPYHKNLESFFRKFTHGESDPTAVQSIFAISMAFIEKGTTIPDPLAIDGIIEAMTRACAMYEIDCTHWVEILRKQKVKAEAAEAKSMDELKAKLVERCIEWKKKYPKEVVDSLIQSFGDPGLREALEEARQKPDEARTKADCVVGSMTDALIASSELLHPKSEPETAIVVEDGAEPFEPVRIVTPRIVEDVNPYVGHYHSEGACLSGQCHDRPKPGFEAVKKFIDNKNKP